MKKNAIIFVVFMMLVPCLLQAKWITLIPGFNDSTATFEVTHSDDDSTIVVIEIPGVWADSFYTESQVFWRFRTKGINITEFGDSTSHPSFLYNGGIICVPDSGSNTVSITDIDDTVLTGYRILPYGWPDSSGYIEIDSMIYDSLAWFHEETTICTDEADWRRINTKGVEFNLYSYKPIGDSIRFNRNARIKITHEGSFDTLEIESWFEDVYRTVFMNFESRVYSTITTAEACQVLYIYNPIYEEVAEYLAYFRQQQGWWVKIISTDDIYDLTFPRKNGQLVKACLFEFGGG